MEGYPPWFPDYYVEVSSTGPDACIQNASDVRLTFRVPNEELEEVLKILLPHAQIESLTKELHYGR